MNSVSQQMNKNKSHSYNINAVGDLFITSSSKGRDCYCTCSIVDVYD